MEPGLLRAFFAQAAGGGADGGLGSLVQLSPLILMAAVVYFIMIRPAQTQAKKHKEYLTGLKKGDEVVTQSGIFGKIDAVEEASVRLEIARDVKIRLLKTQIAGPQPSAPVEAAPK